MRIRKLLALALILFLFFGLSSVYVAISGTPSFFNAGQDLLEGPYVAGGEQGTAATLVTSPYRKNRMSEMSGTTPLTTVGHGTTSEATSDDQMHDAPLQANELTAAHRYSCPNPRIDIKNVVMAGNRPVGTYLCEYFPHAEHKANGSCVLPCRVAGDAFTCAIIPLASPEALYTSDIVVNHHGPVPGKRSGRPLITLFYSGESNHSEGKKALPAYQAKYDRVISFHQHRPLYFTWTNRHLDAFEKIMREAPDDPSRALAILKDWRQRLPAVAVFISRCKKGGRDGVIRALSRHYEVHSFGRCVHTHRLEQLHPDCLLRTTGGAQRAGQPFRPGSARYPIKMCVLRKYRYVLALENTRELDYVTEKVYHALLAGAIPLYDGAPNAADFIPGGLDSLLLLSSFGNSTDPGRGPDGKRDVVTYNANVDYEALSRHLRLLDSARDTSMLRKLLRWRIDTKRWSTLFLRNLYHSEPTCALCQEALLKKRCT